MGRVRKFCLGAMVAGCLGWAATAMSQTGLDDAHVTPRENPVDLASASYAGDPAVRLASGGLIRSRVDLVLVPVTITDDLDRPVLGLDQDNFQLFEGKKLQAIKHFSSEDAPVSVGILVDASGSMSYKLDRAREAVEQFCDAANPQDEFFLITFADEPQLAGGFTTNIEDIKNQLLTVRSKGQTSLLDAIHLGLQQLRNARYARRALLIISDGGDNHSRYTEHDIKAEIRESDVMVYAVGTYERYATTEEEMLGPDLLQALAEQTGGRAFSLSNINDMPAVTHAIGTELRYQYMLAYEPQSELRDGKWHKINVKLRLPKEFHNFFMRVTARPGYYAGGE